MEEVPDDGSSEIVSSMHADFSFTILPRSERIVLDKLKNIPVNEHVCGRVIPRSDLPHHYLIFGAVGIIYVSEDGMIPIRMVNPSAQTVKIFQKQAG